MTRRLVILPAARIELIAAQDWYEQASPGLGRAFRNEARQPRSARLDGAGVTTPYAS